MRDDADAQVMEDTARYLFREFEHPATYLWRTCETALIKSCVRTYALRSPVLDLGCAEGTIARALFAPGDTVIGLDNCWELLSSSPRTEPYRSRLLGDGCRLPFKDRTFSSVFSNCVIEHIPDLSSVLAEVSRVLKPGGQFLFTVPSARFPEYLFFATLASSMGLCGLARVYAAKRNALLNHYHCYDVSAWRGKLTSSGMTLVDSTAYVPRGLLMLWDALAAYFYVVCRVPGICRPQMRVARSLLRATILKRPAAGCAHGGALLIVARKG